MKAQKTYDVFTDEELKKRFIYAIRLAGSLYPVSKCTGLPLMHIYNAIEKGHITENILHALAECAGISKTWLINGEKVIQNDNIVQLDEYKKHKNYPIIKAHI